MTTDSSSNCLAGTAYLVLRENLVRFEHAPIFTRVSDLPPTAPGAHIRIQVTAIDLFAATLECRHAGAAGDGVAADPADLEQDELENSLAGQATIP